MSLLDGFNELLGSHEDTDTDLANTQSNRSLSSSSSVSVSKSSSSSSFSHSHSLSVSRTPSALTATVNALGIPSKPQGGGDHDDTSISSFSTVRSISNNGNSNHQPPGFPNAPLHPYPSQNNLARTHSKGIGSPLASVQTKTDKSHSSLSPSLSIQSNLSMYPANPISSSSSITTMNDQASTTPIAPPSLHRTPSNNIFRIDSATSIHSSATATGATPTGEYQKLFNAPLPRLPLDKIEPLRPLKKPKSSSSSSSHPTSSSSSSAHTHSSKKHSSHHHRPHQHLLRQVSNSSQTSLTSLAPHPPSSPSPFQPFGPFASQIAPEKRLAIALSPTGNRIVTALPSSPVAGSNSTGFTVNTNSSSHPSLSTVSGNITNTLTKIESGNREITVNGKDMHIDVKVDTSTITMNKDSTDATGGQEKSSSKRRHRKRHHSTNDTKEETKDTKEDTVDTKDTPMEEASVPSNNNSSSSTASTMVIEDSIPTVPSSTVNETMTKSTDTVRDIATDTPINTNTKTEDTKDNAAPTIPSQSQQQQQQRKRPRSPSLTEEPTSKSIPSTTTITSNSSFVSSSSSSFSNEETVGVSLTPSVITVITTNDTVSKDEEEVPKNKKGKLAKEGTKNKETVPVTVSKDTVASTDPPSTATTTSMTTTTVTGTVDTLTTTDTVKVIEPTVLTSSSPSSSLSVLPSSKSVNRVNRKLRRQYKKLLVLVNQNTATKEQIEIYRKLEEQMKHFKSTNQTNDEKDNGINAGEDNDDSGDE